MSANAETAAMFRISVALALVFWCFGALMFLASAGSVVLALYDITIAINRVAAAVEGM